VFTGIITNRSKIIDVRKTGSGLYVEFTKPKSWNLKPGESVSVNGICSTVVRKTPSSFAAEYMEETILKTTLGAWKRGNEVNLERSLKSGDALHGHLVMGHVDTAGKIVDIQNRKWSKILKIKIPSKLMMLIAEKGSVTLDGVSLTVVSRGSDWFTVSLISYTLKNTNLKNLKSGYNVNVETDIIAKYLNTTQIHDSDASV